MAIALQVPRRTVPADATPAQIRERRPYRVWAPDATRVSLHVDGFQVPMRSAPDGWWTADRKPKPGEEYGFLVDDEGPFPDPRSASQPHGVHGLSAVVDHARFEWSDRRWQAPPLAGGVLYELHVGTFSPAGTFVGAIARLPHLATLGVTHVELMPVAEFSGAHGWGYDGVDLFAPHHAYGTPDDLKRLVDACHAAGLAVILDVVYNHLGPAGNYLSRFGPYFTSRYSTPWGDAVNFDGRGSDEVRRFFIDNAIMWLRDYHIDGLRLDAVHAIVDTSAVHILEELAAEAHRFEAASGRHVFVTAESDLNDPRVVLPPEAGGYGVDAQWSDDFHHALHSLLTGERDGYYQDFGTAGDLARAITEVFVYGGRYSAFRRRVHGRSPVGLPGWRFIVAAQNHDQIGNRACGERLSHLVSIGRAKIAAALLLTSPFVPLLFQGEEWGASTPFLYFTAHEDPALAEQVTSGRRREVAAHGSDPATAPDPQAADTFDRSRLVWDELTRQPHASLFDWYRRLIALRREQPSLRDGDYQLAHVTVVEEGARIVIRRRELTIACNLAAQPARIASEPPMRLLLASDAHVSVDDDGIELPGESIAILQGYTESP